MADLINTDGMITRRPSKSKDNQAVLLYPDGKCAAGRVYTEKESHTVLNAHHSFDTPSLG